MWQARRIRHQGQATTRSKGGIVAKQPAPKEKKRPKNDAAQAAKKAKKAAKKAGGGSA